MVYIFRLIVDFLALAILSYGIYKGITKKDDDSTEE